MGENINATVIATVKGAVSSIPFAGPILSEYIGLAQTKIADKRIKEWMKMIECKMEKLNCDVDRLSDSEIFYTALHIATDKVKKEFQNEKREYFVNALFNSVQIADISDEKKMIFFNLLEKYTLSSIRLLKLFSKNNYRESDYIEKRGMTTITTSVGQEKLINYILSHITEFKGESELVQNLSLQLFNDGLIENVDFIMPEYHNDSRRKRTTQLGDEFLQFIID